MIVATLAIKVTPDSAEDAIRVIAPELGRTRTEEGCLSCDLYRDADDAMKLILVERWRLTADLERHVRSDPYRRVLAWIDMAVEAPEVRFETVSASRGWDLIEALRA